MIFFWALSLFFNRPLLPRYGVTLFQFLVEEIREAPRQCSCPNGEQNCVCPSPEILEPVVIPINSDKARRAPGQLTPSVTGCASRRSRPGYGAVWRL